LSAELQISPPKIFLIENASAQIFAYAKTRKQTRLFVSEGMLQLLTSRQLRAVLMFQMIAIRQSYTILNYWVAAVLDMFYRLGRACERAFAFIFGWTPPLAAWMLSPWMCFLRTTLLSARDFHKLDVETARALDNPEDLAQALWKLESYAQTRPWPEPWIFAHMCMVSPLRSRRSFSFVRVHPVLSSRIKILLGRYPL
jgi:heat shock protein HtpX